MRPLKPLIGVMLLAVALGGCGGDGLESAGSDGAEMLERREMRGDGDGASEISKAVQPKTSFVAAVDELCEETIARRRAVPEIATPEGQAAADEQISEINEEMLAKVHRLPQPEAMADAAVAADLYSGRERSVDLWDAYRQAVGMGEVERAEAIMMDVEAAEAEVERILNALGISDRCFVG